MPKVQLIVISIVVIYFSTSGQWAAAIYGSLVSLVNTGLINRHTSKQKIAVISAQLSVGLMAYSIIMRMATMVGLLLAGLISLKLSADVLIISLVLGMGGFLMDKVLQK